MFNEKLKSARQCADYIYQFNQRYPHLDLNIYINGHIINPVNETTESLTGALLLHPQPNCRIHFSTADGYFNYKRTQKNLDVNEAETDSSYWPIQVYTRTLLTRFASQVLMKFKAHEIWASVFYSVKYALPTSLEQYLQLHPDHQQIRQLRELVLAKTTRELMALKEVWEICERITKDECKTLLTTQTPNEYYLGRLAEVIYFVHIHQEAGLGFKDCMQSIWHFMGSHTTEPHPANSIYLGVNMHNQILSGHYHIERIEGG